MKKVKKVHKNKHLREVFYHYFSSSVLTFFFFIIVEINQLARNINNNTDVYIFNNRALFYSRYLVVLTF